MADQRHLQHIHNGLARLNSLTGTTTTDAYTLEKNYSRYQIVQESPEIGFRRLSPLLPKAQLYDWLWAYIDGYEAATRRLYEAPDGQTADRGDTR